MTFLIVARDPETGDLGGAVQSKFLGVGGVVLHGRAGVGMVATQAWANVSYGPRRLALLENLEERLVKPGWIDPTTLDVLREG